MYLMQTVSTVPRARPLQPQPAAAPAPRSRSVDRGADAAPAPASTAAAAASTSAAMLLFPGSPLPAVAAVPSPGSPPPPPPAQRRRASGEAAVAAAAAGDVDAAADKKKKWSLGGLFRRRRKPAAAAPDDSDSSSADEAPTRKGFLGRRRSRREKRKPRPKIVGTFDHVVVHPLSQSPLRPRREAEPPCVPSPPHVPPPPPVAASPPSSPPQGPGSRRRDSSLSRCSSGGSGSLDGTGRRTGRRGQAMARAEALRDQRGDSSSDECGGFGQSPPVLRARLDDSSPSTGRRSTRTAARTERHFRRLSRDEEAPAAGAGPDAAGRPRAVRSEERGRWAAVYHESCDTDPSLLTRTPSATPSPKQSPLVRPRHFRHYSPAASAAPDAARTFPPGHGMWPTVRPPPQPPQVAQPARAPPTAAPTRPFARGASPVQSARRQEYAAPPPRPFPSFETVYAKPAAAVPAPGDFPQRSVSYDCDIHRPAPLRGPSAVAGADDVLVVQFPIARLRPAAASPPPPPPRDPQRRLSAAPAAGASAADAPRPMSYAFETGSQQVARVEYCLNQPAGAMGVSGSLRSLGPPGTGWNAYQRRSCSDNQLTAPVGRPRPASATPEAMRPIANGPLPYQKPPDANQPAHFQYYADQNPRSRRPIHIQLRGGSNDQPYLSDSQVVMKPPYQKNPLTSATEFWRQRDQQQHQQNSQLQQQQAAAAGRQTRKPVLSAAAAAAALAKPPHQSDRSRSNSPRPGDALRSRVTKPRPVGLMRPADSQSSLSGASDAAPPAGDSLENGPRPLSMVLENAEAPEPPSPKPTPPAPPARRFSRQSSTSSLEANDWAADDDSRRRSTSQRRSSNLEDALNELEAIYKSLRLGDEDLLERAERREAPAYRPPPPPPEAAYPWRAARCGAESDSGFNYGGERAPRLRRTLGAPDPVTDDMAYRRLHPKERPSSQDARALVSQSGSYLLASPALAQQASDPVLAPPPPPPPAASPSDEPDVTHDDVLFRSIKHANNTLRISDPQPPFGIPLGPVAPAASSDYLHATPVDRPRSAFKPCKIPDVVKDDLAFRALRKDTQKDPTLPPARVDGVEALFPSRVESAGTGSNFSLRKKRAVRSLSANLMGLVHREPLVSPVTAATNEDLEKAQSLSDLPDALQVAQKILEGKEVIGGGPVAALRRLADATPEGLDPHYGVTPSSWVERALLDRSLLGGAATGASTSTETLTDSRANTAGGVGAAGGGSRRGSWQPRPSPPPPAAPTSAPPPLTPPTHPPPPPPLDQTRLDDLLSALAREASATSERLDRELQQLRLEPEAQLDANCNVVLSKPVTATPPPTPASPKPFTTPSPKPTKPPSPKPVTAPSPKPIASPISTRREASSPSPVPPEPAPLRSPEAVAAVVAIATAAAAAAAASTPPPSATSAPATPDHQPEPSTTSELQAKTPPAGPTMDANSPQTEGGGDPPKRHETVDELVSQCRRDLDELLRQVDAATRPSPPASASVAATATAPQGEEAAAAPRWAAGLEPLTALGLALALLLSLLAMLAT